MYLFFPQLYYLKAELFREAGLVHQEARPKQVEGLEGCSDCGARGAILARRYNAFLTSLANRVVSFASLAKTPSTEGAKII